MAANERLRDALLGYGITPDGLAAELQVDPNSHVYGKLAAHAPALHLRRLTAGDLFTIYADSFTAVWEDASRYTW